MSEPSEEAKQAAYGTAERVQQAIDTATAKLREELNKLTEIKRGYERMASTGVWVKTQKYAELAKLAHQQPRRWPSEVPLFGEPAPVNQQPSDELEYDKEAFVECDRCQKIGYDLRIQKCVSCGYSHQQPSLEGK